MTDASLFSPLTFAHGPAMKNRLMLAPLTNTQSHPDGTLSDDEFRWLTMRAEGGFGLTMTCAAHVQRIGQGFPGQLGAWSDDHIEGLTRLAAAIKAQGSVAVVQLHHAGMRSPAELIGEAPVCPSDNEEFKARALTSPEVEQLVADFIAGAVRSQKAGFDGVEIHCAHGYILAQFLSPEVNLRTDQWGGSAANRNRIVIDILKGVRAACGRGCGRAHPEDRHATQAAHAALQPLRQAASKVIHRLRGRLEGGGGLLSAAHGRLAQLLRALCQ
jgi:2,4-dienoyl-CoA reductase-like NADH-dependent reductase (Old Yellow Enzyme family)